MIHGVEPVECMYVQAQTNVAPTTSFLPSRWEYASVGRYRSVTVLRPMKAEKGLDTGQGSMRQL